MIFLILAQMIKAPYRIVTDPEARRAFCERHLVAEDPYQYETSSTGWVLERYREEALDAFWKKKKSTHLGILGDELRKREPTEEILYWLENYSQFERRQASSTATRIIR